MGNGGSSSVSPISSNPKVAIEEVVKLMMPVYYTHNAKITPMILATARASWKIIIENRSEAFQEAKKDPTFDLASCSTSMMWRYTVFYDRLFDVHPMCKPLFRSGLVSQGKFLVRMISMLVNALAYPKKFKKTIEELALRRCERGVKAGEYSIVGSVLFYSLHKCLGEEYTHEVEDAWKKVYSAMIQIIIPMCLKYERSGKVKLEEGSTRHSIMRGDRCPDLNSIRSICSFDTNTTESCPTGATHCLTSDSLTTKRELITRTKTIIDEELETNGIES